MSALTFFRQARADGGVRTGIDIDGSTVLQLLERGPGDPDPALKWYVDLRCEGDEIPAKPEQAREWLLAHETAITNAFEGLGAKVAVGADPDAWPVRWQPAEELPGVHMITACSSIGAIPVGQLGQIVGDIAEHWKDYITQPEMIAR